LARKKTIPFIKIGGGSRLGCCEEEELRENGFLYGVAEGKKEKKKGGEESDSTE